jgi:hypothetical protein
VWQVWTRTGEQSGSKMHTVTTESVSLCTRNEKLTAFLEMESAVCVSGELL